MTSHVSTPNTYKYLEKEVAYFRTNQTTNSFLCATDSLVPRAGGAVGVVLGNTRGSYSSAGNFDGGVRGIVLDLGLVLLGIALSLVASAACQRANGRLDGAGDGVDGGLEGGGVIVGRHF